MINIIMIFITWSSWSLCSSSSPLSSLRVHIRKTQTSVLQTLPNTNPGHWVFTIHIPIWVFSTPWEYTAIPMQLSTTVNKSALTCTRLLFGRVRQFSVACLTQRQHNDHIFTPQRVVFCIIDIQHDAMFWSRYRCYKLRREYIYIYIYI